MELNEQQEEVMEILAEAGRKIIDLYSSSSPS
jgi:hypothetical protein